MKRRLIYTGTDYNINPTFDEDNSKFYTPSVATEFEVIEHKNADGSDSISLTTDIQMLLRQQELLSKDPGFVREYMDKMIANFAQATSNARAMEQLKKDISDEQLMKYIKPRHIQSPTELATYGKYILQEAMDSDSNIREAIEQARAISTLPDNEGSTPTEETK